MKQWWHGYYLFPSGTYICTALGNRLQQHLDGCCIFGSRDTIVPGRLVAQEIYKGTAFGIFENAGFGLFASQGLCHRIRIMQASLGNTPVGDLQGPYLARLLETLSTCLRNEIGYHTIAAPRHGRPASVVGLKTPGRLALGLMLYMLVDLDNPPNISELSGSHKLRLGRPLHDALSPPFGRGTDAGPGQRPTPCMAMTC